MDRHAEQHSWVAAPVHDAEVHEPYEVPAIEERTPVRQPLIGLSSVS